jgi:hypothetical protein
MALKIAVARGSLYLSREVCDQYLSGLATVILQRREHDLAILPVHHAAAGGYLLKRRNARGDRVVNAADFFRFQGLEDAVQREAAVCWDEATAALIATGLFGGEKAR